MTVPLSLTFLAGQVSFMRQRGFQAHAITSPGPELAAFARREGATVTAIEMTRAITPVRDLRALYRLWRQLSSLKPDIVHAHTPKAGLLAMLGASLARVPVRIYHVRGLPFVTESGLRRRLLRATEWMSCTLAHRVFAVSDSMRSIVAEEGVCPREKVRVFLGGSGNGVDATGRFRPLALSERASVRAELGLAGDAIVVGFVGRLTREKGIAELAEAWRELRDRVPRLHLVLVGWNEAEPSLASALAGLTEDPRVHLTGPRADMPRLYGAMDVVALPTWREGFPNVALEAAAMALPMVATAVPGCVDAVQDGVTGTLVPARDARALARALERYAADEDLRAEHGNAGRRRVLEAFRPEAIWEAMVAEYEDLLRGRRPA